MLKALGVYSSLLKPIYGA